MHHVANIRAILVALAGSALSAHAQTIDLEPPPSHSAAVSLDSGWQAAQTWRQMQFVKATPQRHKVLLLVIHHSCSAISLLRSPIYARGAEKSVQAKLKALQIGFALRLRSAETRECSLSLIWPWHAISRCGIK